MFCRNCGKEVNPNAAVCLNCGVNPSAGKKFCQSCGAETTPEQMACVKCGVALAGVVPAGSKSKIAAGLLGIFLGPLGIHKFYLGYSKEGIITLVAFILGFPLIIACGLGYFIILAIRVITLIEGIIYLCKSDADFERIYAQGHKGWF